jgi:hypothetical protein
VQREGNRLQSDTSRYLGDIQNATAQRGQDFSLQSALAGYDVQREGNRLQSDTSRYLGDIQNATAQRGQDFSLQSALAGYDVQREGNRLQSDTSRYVAGLGDATTRRGQDFSLQSANRGYDVQESGNRLAAETARRGQDTALRQTMAPIDWSRERFNAILPQIEAILGGGGPQPAPSYAPVAAGGGGGGGLRANAIAARGERQGVTRQQANARRLTAAGYGANSPLLMALNQMASQGARSATADALSDNALDYARLAEQQRANTQDADIRSRQIAAQRQSALLSALTALAG